MKISAHETADELMKISVWAHVNDHLLCTYQQNQTKPFQHLTSTQIRDLIACSTKAVNSTHLSQA